MRHAADIQYAPSRIPPPPEVPPWLKALNEFFRDLFAPLGKLLGGSWGVVETLLIGGAALLVLYIAWRLIAPVIARRRASDGAAEEAWTPDREQALALLEDADRLAAEGRFAEATHLLLQRSVGQIAQARPNLVSPSATAREIAGMGELPAPARTAFATIATEVERSLFALRELGAVEWTKARDAYANFALANLGSGQGRGVAV